MLISSPFNSISKCLSVLNKSINFMFIWDKGHLLVKVIPRFSPSEQKAQTPMHIIVYIVIHFQQFFNTNINQQIPFPLFSTFGATPATHLSLNGPFSLCGVHLRHPSLIGFRFALMRSIHLTQQHTPHYLYISF